MYGLILVIHILICLLLVTVVLLQSGKGGGLAGGAFGGTAQTVFGGRGATDFMTRATMVLGGAFFLTSLVLALMSSRPANAPRSLLQEEARRSSQTTRPGGPAPLQVNPGQTPPASGSAPQGAPPQQQGTPPPAPAGGR